MTRRVAQLNEAWGVLVDDWDCAHRWRDRRRMPGIAIALKIIDAVAHAEEFPQDNDRDILARLRAIIRQRNIFNGVLAPFEQENAAALAPAEAAEVERAKGEPLVAAVLDKFPGAEIVAVMRREGGALDEALPAADESDPSEPQ
jgi:hypothetical protein